MTVMEAARALGASIQEDARYATYVEAQNLLDNDAEVKGISEKIEALHQQFDAEAAKEDSDEALMSDLQQQASAVYQSLYQTPAMMRVLSAKEGMDQMMNEVMNLLYLVMGGADPATVEVTPETMQQMQQDLMQMPR